MSQLLHDARSVVGGAAGITPEGGSYLKSLNLSYDHYLAANEDLRKGTPNYDLKGQFAQTNSELGLALVYTPHQLRIIDSRSHEHTQRVINYSGSKFELREAKVDKNYLITVLVNDEGQFRRAQTVIELRKMASGGGGGDQGFIRFEIETGVYALQIRILENYNERDIALVLRSDNKLEIRDLSEKGGLQKLVSTVPIHFLKRGSNVPFQVEDFFIANEEREIVFNLDHSMLLRISLEELFASEDLKIHLLSQVKQMTIENYEGEAMMNIFDVSCVTMNDVLLWLVAKSSTSRDVPHLIEVHVDSELNLAGSTKLVKQLQLIVQSGFGIEGSGLNGELIGSSSLHMQRKQQRILEVCVTAAPHNDYFVLIQNHFQLVLFMLNPQNGQTIIQVNEPERFQEKSKIMEELLAASINKNSIIRSIENNMIRDISAQITLISQGGTSLSGADINIQSLVNVNKLAQLTKAEMTDTHNVCFQYCGGVSSLGEDHKLEEQKKIIQTLIDYNLFKKLAEYILMKDNQRGSYLLEAIGTLWDDLEKKLTIQKELHIVDILKQIKVYSKLAPDYVLRASDSQSFSQSLKQEIMNSIIQQLVKLEGMLIVYNAILRRQTEEAMLKQILIGQSALRAKDQEDLNNIQIFISTKVEKQCNFLKIMQFLVQSDYLNHIFIGHMELSSNMAAKMTTDPQDVLFEKQILAFAPSLINRLPLVEVEDYVILLDSSVITSKPLAVLFYHILELTNLGVDLQAHFNLLLEPLFDKKLQESVKALWSLDELASFKNQSDFMQRQISLNAVQKLTTYTEYSNLNNLILQKLMLYNQQEAALYFIQYGGLQNQLKNKDVIANIIQNFMILGKYEDAVIFLKENENYINMQAYKNAFELLIDKAILQNKVQQVIFCQSLSNTQDHLLIQHLEQNWQEVAFAYMIWKRQAVKGVGYGLQLNYQGHQNKQNISAAGKLRGGLVRSYIGALQPSQSEAIYKESHLARQDIEIEIIDAKAATKQGRATLNKQSKEMSKVQEDVYDNKKFTNQSQGVENRQSDHINNLYLADPFFSQGLPSQSKQYRQKQNTLSDFFFGKENTSSDYNNQQQFMVVDSNSEGSAKQQLDKDAFTSQYRCKLGFDYTKEVKFVLKEPLQQQQQLVDTRLFPNRLDLNIHEEVIDDRMYQNQDNAGLLQYPIQYSPQRYSPRRQFEQTVAQDPSNIAISQQQQNQLSIQQRVQAEINRHYEEEEGMNQNQEIYSGGREQQYGNIGADISRNYTQHEEMENDHLNLDDDEVLGGEEELKSPFEDNNLANFAEGIDAQRRLSASPQRNPPVQIDRIEISETVVKQTAQGVNTAYRASVSMSYVDNKSGLSVVKESVGEDVQSYGNESYLSSGIKRGSIVSQGARGAGIQGSSYSEQRPSGISERQYTTEGKISIVELASEQEISGQEYENEDEEEEEDEYEDPTHPGGEPKLIVKNKKMKQDAELVMSNRSYKKISKEQLLTRSKAKNKRIQDDELLELPDQKDAQKVVLSEDEDINPRFGKK